MANLTSLYIINLNGKIGTPDEIKLSILDRGLLFGDSIYEVTRTYAGIPSYFKEHFERLGKSAEGIAISNPFNYQFMQEQVAKTLAYLNQMAGKKVEAYLRIMITRGEGEIGLDPTLAGAPNLIIIAKEFTGHPASHYSHGVPLILAETLRNHRRSIDPSIKSGNYLNNMFAYMEAKKLGAYEAIMCNQNGHITEGTTSNIWIVKESCLKTPPLEAGLLNGITREVVLAVAREHGIKVEETNLLPLDLFEADECFITSSTREIVPASKIDSIQFQKVPGPITKKLMVHYSEHLARDLKSKSAVNF